MEVDLTTPIRSPCNYYLRNKIRHWAVCTEPYCSYHRHIIFNIETGPRPMEEYHDSKAAENYFSGILTLESDRRLFFEGAKRSKNG